MKRIYLDANATTPLDSRVREAMIPWLDAGNPSSLHAEGRAARDAIDRAREQVAALVGAGPREIVFTSGATEANALALLGSVRAHAIQRAFCSAVEHPAVLRTLEGLRPDLELVVGHVDARGILDAEIPADVGLVSVMLANNETGAIQPVRAVAERAAAIGAIMHTDAVQACGKLHVDVNELGVDLLTLSAHKMHGPKGAGALYAKRGTALRALYHGGEHERGLRAGTENVAAIVGLGAAAELAANEVDARCAQWVRQRDLFLGRLAQELPDVRVNSTRAGLPNTISLTFPHVEGEAVLLGLDLEGIAIATGSACSSGAAEPSHVLMAIGLTREEAERSVRISMHAQTTDDDIVTCVTTIARVVKNLRALQV